MPKQDAISKIAQNKTSEEFADALSSYSNLTSDQLAKLFPEQSDKDEIIALLKIVNSAADDNTKKAELVAKISDIGGAVIKVAKHFATGL
ncbi:hypothetical protein [Methylomonas albis]|uniref:Uncharacterized protein n=1 Tax=Methylomonas albis TaxID=1854563 RepID=A0ABR9D683_9GAMM|nr:hypothetical protein [Methylomonas albis]MBD9358617.1 hypothetical protein [Methylomonas albis]CAD6882044.1 hypothetical protein [Methylomonas albis]